MWPLYLILGVFTVYVALTPRHKLEVHLLYMLVAIPCLTIAIRVLRSIGIINPW